MCCWRVLRSCVMLWCTENVITIGKGMIWCTMCCFLILWINNAIWNPFQCRIKPKVKKNNECEIKMHAIRIETTKLGFPEMARVWRSLCTLCSVLLASLHLLQKAWSRAMGMRCNNALFYSRGEMCLNCIKLCCNIQREGMNKLFFYFIFIKFD